MTIGSREVFEQDMLPYDAELQWMKSDGKAWINTGIHYNDEGDMTVEAHLTVPTTTPEQCYISNQDNATSRFVLGFANDTTYQFCRSNDVTEGNAVSKVLTRNSEVFISAKYNTKTSLKEFIVDSMKYTAPFTLKKCGNPTRPIAVFTSFKDASITCPYVHPLYSIKFAFGDEVKFDAIPVRKDGVGCLYDKVSKTLFKNSGQGAFILGPDKK